MSTAAVVSEPRRGRSPSPVSRTRGLCRAVPAAVLCAVALLSLFASGPGAATPASREGSPRAVVLRAGETVWDVAERYAPRGMDPRAYVDAVLELNGSSGLVRAGQRLRLPR